MKRLLFLVILMACAVSAKAQTRTAVIGFNASTTPGVSSYKIEKAPCPGTVTNNACSQVGTYATLTTVGVVGLSFADATLVPGQGYVYRIRAVCPAAGCGNGVAGESATPSNPIAILAPPLTTPPPSTPNAPTNVTITIIVTP